MGTGVKADPKRVGLFGLFGQGNFGNDGSLESALIFLRAVAPHEPLLCICGDPATVKRAFDLDAVPIYYRPARSTSARAATRLHKAAHKAILWFHAIRHLRRVKILIVPGTGILDDFGAWPLSWPYDLLSWCLLGRLMGVKIVFASVGAGPIRHPISRWIMKAAARAAHYRSYRDTISKTFMESIGFDTRNDPVYPDIAFRLPPPLSARRQETAHRAITVGVGVMAYHGWRNDDSARGAAIYADYLGKMTTFVCWLLDRGYLVCILMGDEADRPTVDDLCRAVRSSRPDRAEDAIVFAPAHTLQDVMQQMAGTDVIVATRYHNIVCALRVGKPTISIGYAGKNDALLAEVGLAAFCQHIERLDVDLLKSQTAQLISDRAAFEQRICDAQVRFQSRLSEQEDLLASLIYSSSS
jgi:polysaccharide pyruvyl transferase WcaK-like protein